MEEIYIKAQVNLCQEINSICQPWFDILNIGHFSHVRIYKDNKYNAFCTHPEWIEFYLRNEVFNLDSGSCTFDSYFSSIGLAEYEKLPLINNEPYLSCLYNLTHGKDGFMLSDKSKEYVNLFCFTCRNISSVSASLLLTNVGLLKQFIQYFQDTTIQHGLSLEDTQIYRIEQSKDFLEINSGYKLPQEIVQKNDDLQVECFDYEKKRLVLGKNSPDNYLTKQETRIFYHMILGKSSTKIADEANLSVRTIENHFNSVKSKMGFRSKADLVNYARSRGLDELIKLDE